MVDASPFRSAIEKAFGLRTGVTMPTRKQTMRGLWSISTSADGTPGSSLTGHGTRNADGSWVITLTDTNPIEPGGNTGRERRSNYRPPG